MLKRGRVPIHMIVMTFDLSSVCIGVTFAEINDEKKILYGETLAIIPKKPTGKDLGYTTNTPKKISSKGNTYGAFLKPDEILISKKEAERRKSTLKTDAHNHLLRNIGKQCGRYLDKIKPDIVAIERNKSFNGILTTKLLAEIAGGIYFYCGANDILMFDWDEATVRSMLRKDIPEFSLSKYTDDTRIAIDTKWEIYCRLRYYFETEHPGIFNFEQMTLDESDSLAVFYYLYKKIIKGAKVNETSR